MSIMDALQENMVAIVIASIIFAIPFILEIIKKHYSHHDSKEHAPGDFARLSQGMTHFHWVGPADGRVIVAIHGLTSPSQAWKVIAAGLGKAGFRVLVYDLYGRGYSEAVDGCQDRRFFLTQLKDLLDHQNLKDDLILMGYSMGGSIATTFAAENKSLVQRLILVATAGITISEPPVSKFVRMTPWVGDWFHHLIGGPFLHNSFEAQRGTIPIQVEGIIEVQTGQLQKRGFLTAVLSSLRGLIQEVLEEEHRIIAQAKIPVVAIWGEQDDTIPIESCDLLRRWNTEANHEILEGAGHALTYSHSIEVLDKVKKVLI